MVDAPGPAEFIEMAIPLLKQKSEVEIAAVKNSPYEVLRKFKPQRCDTQAEAELLYKKFAPDLLVTAVSSLITEPLEKHVLFHFTNFANADKKPIICFQDFWANHRWPVNFHLLDYWNKMLVPDDLSKRFLLEDGYKGEIVVTGNPSFDRFGELDVKKDREWLRKKFGVEKDDFVIMYLGRGTPASFWADEITFPFFAKTIKQLQEKIGARRRILVILRPHPRDEDPGRYKRMAPDLPYLDASEFPSTDDLLPIADLMAGMYATNHIHACYMRIPGVVILLPNAGKKIMDKISLPDFPPNQLGATIGIYEENVELLTNTIIKIMDDENFKKEIRQNQEKYFPIPSPTQKTAAQKVAEEILGA